MGFEGLPGKIVRIRPTEIEFEGDFSKVNVVFNSFSIAGKI